MSKCAPGWDKPIFEKAMRPNVKSTFRGGLDTHIRFKEGEPGRADFLAWAAMPKISYSAAPDTLYDMPKLRKLLESNDCYVQSVVDAQTSAGVIYPNTFYLGLLMGGTAVLYTLFRGK